MTLDEELSQLFDELVNLLELDYGSIEIKVHDGKFSHYLVTKRKNRNDLTNDKR